MATPQLADIVLCSAGAVGALAVSRALARGIFVPDRVAALAAAVAMPVEGPLGDVVAERVRGVAVTAWRATAATLAVAALVALGPLGAERVFLLGVLVVLLVVRTGARAVALARLWSAASDALGDLAVGAPRPSEYLTPVGRMLPWLALPATAAIIGLAVPGASFGAVLAATLLVLTVAAAAAQRTLEQRVVDSRRSAADPLALAWDDVFRARAVAAGRSAVCQAAAVAAAIALPLDSAFLTAAAAIVGILLVRSVYTVRPLPPTLRPRRLGPRPTQAWQEDAEPS